MRDFSAHDRTEITLRRIGALAFSAIAEDSSSSLEGEARLHTALCTGLIILRNFLQEGAFPVSGHDVSQGVPTSRVLALLTELRDMLAPPEETASHESEQAGLEKYREAHERTISLRLFESMYSHLLSLQLDPAQVGALNPEVLESLHELDRQTLLSRIRSGEQRHLLAAQILPLTEIRDIVRNTEPEPDSLRNCCLQVLEALRDYITTGEDEYTGFSPPQLLRDAVEVLRHQDGLTPHERFVLTIMEILPRFMDAEREQPSFSKNPLFISDGISRFSLAESFSECAIVDETEPFAKAREFLKEIATAAGYRSERAEQFLTEVQDIYQGLPDTDTDTENAKPVLSTKLAMRWISALTERMEAGELSSVLQLAEQLERYSIRLYHEFASPHDMDQVRSEQRILSKWARGAYTHDFGGGLYFWGAQQEWYRPSNHALAMVFPIADLFPVLEVYRPSDRRAPAPSSGFRKQTLVCMVPAFAIEFDELDSSAPHPPNNEQYSAGTIATIVNPRVEEPPFIWRLNRQHRTDNRYQTEFFIDAEKERVLRRVLGDEIGIERGITRPDFVRGEYDRLIVTRKTSVLQACAVAYSLRIPEVIYDDMAPSEAFSVRRRLDQIREHAETEASRSLVRMQQDPSSQTHAEFIEALLDTAKLNEEDRILVTQFLVALSSERREELRVYHHSLISECSRDLPLLAEITELIPKGSWFIRESEFHGTDHLLRVLINAEHLHRLASEDPDLEESIDRRALQIAAVLHDTQRAHDGDTDWKHGPRAGAFLKKAVERVFPEVTPETRRAAIRAMALHSLDDRTGLSALDRIFKDADALDRYRYPEGPDLSYLRFDFAKKVAPISRTLAHLSQHLLDNGYRRSTAVLIAASALGLVRHDD
ncbi:hypothetical protein MRY87_09060 [bacterium]|nr:hypothetical protein [bacterium]